MDKMIKRILLMILLILILPSVSAIRINEVESNPLSDFNEWVELYNDGESDLNISSWEIWEGVYGSQGPQLIQKIPEGTIIPKSGFYTIEWSQSKLNNGGDFVILYDSLEKKIDETETLKDSLQDDRTHQLCETWEFIESTKGEENDCVIEDDTEPPINDFDEDEDEYEDNDNDEETNETATETINITDNDNDYKALTENTREPITAEIIRLNPPQTIKSEDDGEINKNLSDYAIYGFVVFCVLLGFLFILKKYKAKKNETEW